MRLMYRSSLILLSLFIVRPAVARLPDWVQPLLKEDVTALAGHHRIVRLADTGEVRFDGDGHALRTYRGAIRVMTEKGKSAAICSWWYNGDTERILAARAWIVAADNVTIDPVVTTDFADTALYDNGIFWPQRRNLQFDASSRIDVKGVLVWEFQLKSQTSIYDMSWSFPQDTPTVLSAYDVIPSGGSKLVWHATDGVPPPVPGSEPGALHWEERRFVPPAMGDRPTGFLPTSRLVAVRMMSAAKGAHDTTWTDFAHLASGIFEPRIETISPELTAKASALAAGRNGRWDRIRALSEYVQREISYLSVTLDRDCLAGYRPHAAREVFENRFGDCKDKATLLIAMLRTIGEQGFPMLLFAGNPKAVLADWPSPQFNHMIICVPADDAVPQDWPVITTGAGRMVVFDPTSEYTPLGRLPQMDQAGHGLLLAENSPELVTIPTLDDEDDCAVDMKIDVEGNLTSNIVRTMHGANAADEHGRRDLAATAAYTKVLEGMLKDSIPSLDNLAWTDSWDARDARWIVTLVAKADRFANRSANLLLVTPYLTLRSPPAAWKTRIPGMVWMAGEHVREVVHMSVPAGAALDEVPDAWSASTPYVTGHLQYQREANQVVCTKDFSIKAAFLDRDAYEEMRSVLLRLESAAHRPVVLKLTSGAVAATK